MNGLRIRPMTVADVPFAMELKNIARWNQVEADWLGYLAYEPDGCFVAEVGGRPAGTATTIGYHGKIGWIGMVLVYPDHRRQGIGTALYTRLLADLRELGVHAVLGGIALPNEASIALHERFAMHKVAHLAEVGYKFGRWVDVGYWQRIL